MKRSRWEWAAIAAWTALLLGITLRLLLGKDLAHNNVYLKVFAAAGNAFAAGGDLYQAPGTDGGFRYPPLCAALFVPFAKCGPLLGSLLWRAVNALVLLLGMRALFAAGLPVTLTSRERALCLGLLVLTSLLSLNNGQANPLLLGLMLLATTGTLRARTAGAAMAMTVATACKVYPFAYGMVLATLRPRLWVGLGVGLLLIAVLPYALQRADYITAQYRHLYELLAAEDRTGDLGEAYRDLRLVTASLGLPMPALLYTALQVIGGLAIVLVARARRRAGEDDIAVATFALSATLCWFLLLGPATEKATYQLIGPPLAFGLIAAFRSDSRLRQGLLLMALLLVVLDNLPLPSTRSVPLLRCLQPFAALLVVVDLALSSGVRRNAVSVLR